MFFLPGASGAGAFWQPVADLLPPDFESHLFDWPGLGEIPRDPSVNSLQDMVDLVLARIGHRAVDLVAQSMGGVVAVRVALGRPDLIRRLVLVATSGGVDLSPFDMEDWRPEYRGDYPDALPFITDPHHEDLSEQLRTLSIPCLLLWGQGRPHQSTGGGAGPGIKVARCTIARARLFRSHVCARSRRYGGATDHRAPQ
ncbi:MAG: alpha/beta fold hydrolase [Chloroflexi bacterium]|nr:alpha/beta fold hydrolase [Chloroflexota bacterium]